MISAPIFYTYIHHRADDGKVFYVGKGCGNRAWQTGRQRSDWWKRVAQKHGVEVHIASHWPTEDEAFSHEKFLISCFRGMGAPLVNVTDGGEGPSGFKHSPQRRARLSALTKGRPGKSPSKETRQKLSNALKGRTFRSGFKLSPELIARRTATRLATAPKFSADGMQKSAREWSHFLGLHISTIQYRIKTGKLVPVENAV